MEEPLFILAPMVRALISLGLAAIRRRCDPLWRLRRRLIQSLPRATAAASSRRPEDSVPTAGCGLTCLFLNYSPINTVFDWCYSADGSIACVYIGTLLFNGAKIGLIVKKMARSGVTSRAGVSEFRTSRLARYDRLREDQFSCLFELRCTTPTAASKPGGRRLLLRGVANLHQPESHFIFVVDAEKLTPMNLLFYQNSVVPDYDPFSDTIFMPQKLPPVPAFALLSLHPVTFAEVDRVEFAATAGAAAAAEAPLADRFFSVQVKVGRIFSIALISIYVAEQGSMDYQLKVYDRASRQIVCQTSFFESGFSFYRFLVQDDCIMFFSLMAHLKRYRIVPVAEDAVSTGGVSVVGVGTRRRQVELQGTRELRSCVGSRAPSLWPHKDCRHGDFVTELFAWTLQREEFNLRGILCCSLAAYERGLAPDAETLAHMLAVCSEDSGDNVVTACQLD